MTFTYKKGDRVLLKNSAIVKILEPHSSPWSGKEMYTCSFENRTPSGKIYLEDIEKKVK